MTKSEILKELKEIQRLISENTADLWPNHWESTTPAVITENICQDWPDMEQEEGTFDVDYNGWGERLDNLIETLNQDNEEH